MKRKGKSNSRQGSSLRTNPDVVGILRHLLNQLVKADQMMKEDLEEIWDDAIETVKGRAQ